ncbi:MULTISPECIES: hypothetical protein [unclassified Haloarcula]|uniref:hypothetical protein n=1 Tax=unclassified Haloarcula TaxID=2624677 RepID=UPI000B08C5EC|nr:MULTISPECIES: hypothetical protein [unclassified Haloarcula]
MAYDTEGEVPKNRCGTELSDGRGYCAMCSLRLFLQNIDTKRCRHHVYLDGEEEVIKYEEAVEARKEDSDEL